MTPEQLTQARTRLSQCRNAYEVAALTCELLGITEGELYQACPKMHKRTVQRVNQARPATDSDLSVAKDTGLSSNTSLILPDVLSRLTDLAQKARVKAETVLLSLRKYGNSPEAVQERLEALIALERHGKAARKPTGLFVSSMRTGQPIRVPDAVDEKPAPQPEPEPLTPGEVLPYEDREVTVLSVGVNLTRLLDDDGTEFSMGTEQVRRLRRAAPVQPEPAAPRPPAAPLAPLETALSWLDRLKRGELRPG